MIVPMKKVSLVSLTSDVEQTLTQLRKAGILHLEYGDAKSLGLQQLRDERANAERAHLLIPPDEPKQKSDQESDLDVSVAISRILEIAGSKRDMQEEIEGLARELERFAAWGEFDPGDLDTLAEAGIPVRLYLMQKDRFQELEEDIKAFIVQRDKANVRFAMVGEGLENALEMAPPSESLSSMEKRLSALKERLANFDEELAGFIPAREFVEKRIAELDRRIEFELAALSMEDSGGLSHITGFVPEIKITKLTTAAKKHSWALLIKDPDEEDVVPVLLKNKKPVRIISPIFDLLGAMPGYREYDISFWFLMFFTLFFAMIIGDAGYGFIFLTLTTVSIIVRKIRGKAAGRELFLLAVLSIATMVWGSLSGTWFGSQVIAEAAPFKYLVVEQISTFNPRSSETVKYFCFIIGTAQIILAHGWNFLTKIRKKPRIAALGEFGWMAAVFGLFYLVLNLVLDPVAYPIPQFALLMIFGGLGSVVIFGEQDGKFFRGILKGLSGLFQTFLDSISAFADVISYIRLFAVGLATVEIAKSFNAMAADMGSSIVGLIGSILVLVIGHGINIAMGALSVIVHGVRLNMLEFSGHLGMEWTGISYAPFQEQAGEAIESE